MVFGDKGPIPKGFQWKLDANHNSTWHSLTGVRKAAGRQQTSTNQRGKRGSSWETKVTTQLLDLFWCWNDVDPGTRQIESKETMPALCCYDTYISLKMTLKSTRGSNIVLFIRSLGRALTLRDSLSTAEYGPCQKNFASGMRTVSKCDMGSQPRGSGRARLLPAAAWQDGIPLRQAKGWATGGDSPAMHWSSQTWSQGQGVDPGFILCKSMEKLLVTPCVNGASVCFRPCFSPGSPLQWSLHLK